MVVPAPGKLGPLDYTVPEDRPDLQVGHRVLVPLGSRRCMGIVTKLGSSAETGAKLRDLIDVLDELPILRPALLQLVTWIADYYLASVSESFANALPGALKIETEKIATALDAIPSSARPREIDRKVMAFLVRNGPSPVASIHAEVGAEMESALIRLRRRKIVGITERFVREVAPTRHEVSYSAQPLKDPTLVARRPALRALHEYLTRHPAGRVAVRELSGSFANAAAKIRQLRDLGLVRQHRREIYRDVQSSPPQADKPVHLNPDQSTAVQQITACLDSGFAPHLLLGVTGSGKTEVYLRIIAETLERKRTALILVPEISLTHQIVGRVRARFGNTIAVLHSGLGVGERWDEWRRLSRGEARIAIGARSAVFAPMQDLGIIIVDEEHDSAYKQADGVRYHGRDVAVMRAKLEGCSLVLGSATASMESLHNARANRYSLQPLPERVEKRPMPAVEILDLRGEKLESPLSPALRAAVEANLTAGGQTLLFLNRRGFANALQCRACGEAVTCPNCSIALTWHQRANALRCHYCDHTISRPETCAECGQNALDIWGWGTERLEELLTTELPGARIARMDRDTTRRKGSLATLLGKWNAGKLDVLIGTQMVTKGHDVAGVTLVGVIMADLTLNLPDFRSAERGFQQLAQVAGRSGRGDKHGRVIIQTLQPDHYVLQAAANHDFQAFTEQELAQREELGYPPFGRIALLRFEADDENRTHEAARQCAEHIRARAPHDVAVLGPAPAPLARLRGRYRWHILVRGRNGAALRQLAQMARSSATQDRGSDLRVTVDIDPQSLL